MNGLTANLFQKQEAAQAASPHIQGLAFLHAQGGRTARNPLDGKLFSEAEIPRKPHRRASKVMRFFRRKAAGRRTNNSTAKPFSEVGMPHKPHRCESKAARFFMRSASNDVQTADQPRAEQRFFAV